MRFPALLALALALTACAAPQQRASDVLPGERSAIASAHQVLTRLASPSSP
jgi:hypothetical protein